MTERKPLPAVAAETPPVCVLRDLLHQQARSIPHEVFAVFEDGESWTFEQTLHQVQEVAAGLAALGVRQGDSVALWLAHGPVALRTWFAVNYLGAVAVPINLAYKGKLLERVLHNSGARLMVLQSNLLDRLQAVELANLACVVTVGDSSGRAPAALSQFDERALHASGSQSPEPPVPIKASDLQVILYTSGTTGPSKGVLCSYLHLWCSGHNVYFLSARDRYMVNLPLAHVSGVLPCMLMLALGGSIAVVERF